MEVVLTNLTSSDESTRREALRALPALLFEGLTSPSLSTLVRLVNIAEKMHRLPTTKVLDAASNTLKLSGAKLDASSVLLLILDAAEMPCETRSNLETVALETFVHSLVCGDATGGKSCFWNVVHNGLRLPVSNRGVRKLATSLLVRGLDYVKRFEAERAVDVAIQAWDTFILFLDALEDFPPHLLDELWDAKASVFVSRPDKIVSNSVDPFITTCTSPVYVDNIPIPTFVAPMSFVWASVIFDRAYSHDNPSVRRSFLTKTFTHAVLCAGDARGPATTAAITAIPGGPIPSSSESQDSISAGYVPLGNYTSSSLPEEYEEKAGSNFGLVLGSFVPGGETRKAAAASADVAAAAAAASAVSSISESRPISIGLSFPTWFVASPCGSHLLTHLNESSLFTGALETTGRGLHDFILSYGAVLFEQRSSNNKEEFSAWVRALVEGLYACMICKGAVKWVLRSLAAISLHIHHRQVKCNNSMIPTIALPRPLNESSLSSLRMIYSGISLINTRTFTRNVALTVINVISTLCDPSLIPIPDLAMTLSMLPASIVLIKREGRQIIEQWLASSNVLTGQSDDDENLGPLLLRLRTAIDAYLSGKLPQVMIENLKVASTPPLLLSAAGLARIATLALDYNGNKKDTVAKKSAMSLFNSLTSALSSLQSRSYLDPKLRSRAILLTEALVFAAFAKGGRGDAHLSFSISGGALPTAPSEIQVPLFAEWSAASRFAVAAYSKIYMRAPLQDSWENPAAPFEDESDFENSIEISHCSSLTNMSTYVLSLSVVAEEFSATLESVIAEGLSLSTVSPTARAIWCPRHGILDKGKESAGRKFDNVAPYPPPPLPFYTALCILRDLSRIQGEGTHLYKTSSERLVNMAIRVLHTISTSTDSLSSASTAIRFVNITNALHTLASLYSSISGDSVSISDVIKSCLCVISSKPRGSTEPALPVHLGNSPSMLDVTNLLNENQQWRSFSNEFSNTTCPLCCPTFDTDKRVLGDEDSRNSSSEKAVSWMSLRSSLETSRWLSIASCLSALLSERPSLSHTYSTSPQGKQSLLACLPLDLAEDLAVATMDALSICSDGSSGVAVLYVSGLVLRALPLEGEDSSHIIMANDVFNKSSKGDNVLIGSSVRFEDFLDALERIMITPKTSRRLAEAYASCVASPELFMRTSLHISISGAGYGPLLRHLLAIVELFSTESANHHLLQCLTSKLCIVWASLFQVSEEKHSLEATTTCRKVLLANVPLMTRLLLHREFLSIHEDPALCDATARAQLREWIRYHRGDDEAAEFDKSTTVARSLRPHGSAGALVRIQMLCWLERMLTVKGAINRQTMLLVVKDLTLLLLTLNMTPELMVESIPGSTMHSTKLRAWQALSLIAREWGRFGIEGDDSNSKYCKISDVFLIDADDEMTSRRIARAEALLPSSPAAASVICTRFLALAAPPIPQNATKLKAKKGKSQVAAISGDDGGIFTKSRDVNTLMTFEDIADLALAFQIVVFKHQLSLTQQPSTRQYLEACSGAVARRFPTTSFKAVLLSLLSAGYAKTQLAFSLMLVCADLASSLALRASSLETLPASTKSMLASLSYQIIVATFPWTSSPMGLVRVVAISSLVRTVTILFPDSSDKSNRKPSLLPPPPGLDEWVRPLIRLSMNSPDLKDMIQRQEKHFARLHPENALSIESLLTSPSTEHGELISADAYSYFKATFQRITVELHERDPANIVDEDFLDARADAAMKAGLIPRCSQIDQRYCLGFGDSTFHGPFGSDSNEVQQSIHSPEEAMNLQRKINSQMALSASAKEKTSHSELSVSTSEDSVRPHAATLSLREKHHPLLTFAAEPSLNAGSDSVRGDEIPDGRRYQPAIVLASLVTKVPNLGGLARTCEVLGLQSLVVHDIRIRSDQEFKSISVSAVEWLPIHGCRAEHMLSYVRARRKQGYTIVGLEQAARSVRLGSAACILPDQCVFVLGAEKEGIPVALLQELDIVVEIPQLGMTRSMNVHVSASLLLWEYTRQRMNRAGFE
jgi:tRNA guanosine-2'-O-methyltransferase